MPQSNFLCGIQTTCQRVQINGAVYTLVQNLHILAYKIWISWFPITKYSPAISKMKIAETLEKNQLKECFTFHHGQPIICSFETLWVPNLIFSEYKNINIWFHTAQGWKVRIPNAHCTQGDIHTKYRPSGSVLHFTWDRRAMKSLEKLFMILNQMVHSVRRC